MARINIEDSLYQDTRFIDLYIKLNSVEMALGCMVRAWSLAQKWYLTESRMIPIQEWKKHKINQEIINSGMAEIIGDFVRVAGADDQFAWLAQKVEAGRKGGLATRYKKLNPDEATKRHGARVVLSKAVQSGKLVRPDFCQDCGSPKMVEGHHDDYDKPLEVKWLCKKCHQETHKLIESDAKHPLHSANHSQSDSKRVQSLLTPSLSPPHENTYIQEPRSKTQIQIEIAWEVWNDTLEFFEIPKGNIAPPQESSIARAINTLGFDTVLLALEGARFESPGKDFRPQDHLSVDRALHKDRYGKSNWERFKNLALANKGKTKTTKKNPRIISVVPNEYPKDE